MNAFLYYLVVFPLSKAPLWFTYRFADLFYLLLISIFPYRRKVINRNIRRSFPEISRLEIQKMRKQFYWHFSNMLIEGVKNLSISPKELKKRFKINNPELMDRLYDNGKSVVLVSAHYANWEWMISGQSLFFKHQAVGIGMPLTSGFWDKKINKRRERFGMHVIHAHNVHERYQNYQLKNKQIATLTLADQSPGDSSKSYWMNFLKQQTAIAFGAEQLANKYNHAVVFYLPKIIKRGYYEVDLELLTEDSSALAWGELTEMHVKRLELALLKNPSPWLWSHKRWKREVPKEINLLKKIQRDKFNKAFRS